MSLPKKFCLFCINSFLFLLPNVTFLQEVRKKWQEGHFNRNGREDLDKGKWVVEKFCYVMQNHHLRVQIPL